MKVQQLLEGRVAERTRQLETALAQAGQQRASVAEAPQEKPRSGTPEAAE